MTIVVPPDSRSLQRKLEAVDHPRLFVEWCGWCKNYSHCDIYKASVSEANCYILSYFARETHKRLLFGSHFASHPTGKGRRSKSNCLRAAASVVIAHPERLNNYRPAHGIFSSSLLARAGEGPLERVLTAEEWREKWSKGRKKSKRSNRDAASWCIPHSHHGDPSARLRVGAGG